MRELRLVGLDEDGALVLVGPEVGSVRLAVDDRLRAAVLGDRRLLEELAAPSVSRLSVREIQSRLRAGASPDEVAADAGVSVESVRRYAGPVLDERQHVVDAVRRAATAAGGTVGAAVPAHATWAAARGDDARWRVTATWSGGSARFGWQPAERRVVPLDDTARVCLGLGPMAPPAAAGLDLVGVGRPTPSSLPAVSSRPPRRDGPRRLAAAEPPREEAPDRAAEADGVEGGRRASVPAWDDILFGTRPPAT